MIRSITIQSALMRAALLFLALGGLCVPARATTVELNSTGGTSSANGLHIYIDDLTKMQIRRLNNTGQLYNRTSTPSSTSLDNGIILYANGKTYGPSHSVGGFAPDGGGYSTTAITAASPANPASPGVPQSTTLDFGIAAGPQVTVKWTYVLPYDFITAAVTVVIPTTYSISATNPVRYYQAIDTFLGGSDNGCGVTYTDSNGHRVVGTYPPPSGTSCPSSTSIPAGVSIVESFRERSGSFSGYCTAYYYDFWDKTKACAVWGKKFPNTVTTTYMDTGVGIHYDFTAPGTYTFSYDFVIGSPAVPPYDHLEIQHDGSSGNLCSAVTVLGCLSGTVPCPAGQSHNASFSTNLTPASPTATWNPDPVAIAAGDLQRVVQVQFATGGSYTLGATNFSQIPLNGVKCWNRGNSSQSCGFTAANVPCYAKGLDACSNPSGAPARCGVSGNRLYTKATGQAVAFDLVALNAQVGGSVDTAFSGTVTVDLVDNPSFNAADNTCAASGTKAGLTGSSQNIVFSGGYPQTPANFSFAAGSNTVAAKNVRVRFTQGSLILCSLDQFAIRPAAFAVSAWDSATQLNNGTLTGNPFLKAGRDFTLRADGGSGYVATSGGAVTLDSSLAGQKVWTHVGSGDFTDRLLASATAGNTVTFTGPGSGSTVATATVQYHDWGLFTVKTGAVVDADFASASGDPAASDCVTGSSSNTANGAGKIGCNIANQVDVPIGRFAVDHFTAIGSLTPACVPASGSSFTYMGQPFPAAQVQARAESYTSNMLLTHYDTAQVGAAATLATFTPKVVDGATDLTTRVLGWTSPFTWSGGIAGYSGAALYLGRAGAPANPLNGAPDGPYSAIFNVSVSGDADLCSGTGKCLDQIQVGSAMAERYGRVKLMNAYGTRDSGMRMPFYLEYRKGNGWVTNTDDSCTVLTGAHVAPGNPTTANADSSGITLAAAATVSPTRSGVGSVFLTRPSGVGWLNVALNLAGTVAVPDQSCMTKTAAGGAAGLTYLRYGSPSDRRWSCPTGLGGSDPWARATFGAARNAGQTIYQRENY